ncbi:hypothetical protein AB2B38_002665 [Balneola sp. MJW-20]|uniref:hypothetical protein n=1 Tax=Gracilimonas aurantiaca TaxID=3234185 RepID=UPI003465F34E
MNNYIAVLDRQHLENTIFLTSFARSLAQQKTRKGIILHGDSEYTDRLIQTGMMREDAEIRAIRDLNRRLIGLFADQGVSAIGLNGYQKGLIRKVENELIFDKKGYRELPETPFLLLSNLIENDQGEPLKIDLPELTRFLVKELKEHDPVIFSMSEKDELMGSGIKDLNISDLSEDQITEMIPPEFRNYPSNFYLLSPSGFGQWPDIRKGSIIRNN